MSSAGGTSTPCNTPLDPQTAEQIGDERAAGGYAQQEPELGEIGPGCEQDGKTASIGDILAEAGFDDLGENSPLDSIETAVRDLAPLLKKVDPLRLEMAREEARRRLKDLGIQAATRIVDAALSGTRDTGASGAVQGRGLDLTDPEPWPDPVNGAELLDEISAMVRRFLVLPTGATEAVTLWIVLAHCFDAFHVLPLLAIWSPLKRCGKTNLLTVLQYLVPRALPSSNVTGPVVFRAIEKYRPTLLIDEADTFLRDKEDLRGIINCGHTKESAFVLRAVGEDHEPRQFSTWCPKAIAQIGQFDGKLGTLQDRAIEVPLKRKTGSEKVESIRSDKIKVLMTPLQRRAARFAIDNLNALKQADPQVPAGLNDREKDNWRPLLAIADLGGTRWQQAARDAAVTLSSREERGPGDQILADMRHVFDKAGHRLRSEEVVQHLVKMEHRPWAEWWHGQPITVNQLAKLLQPFGLRPGQMKRRGKKIRGYNRERFKDAFSRYLVSNTSTSGERPSPQPGTNGTSNRHKELQRSRGGTQPNRVPPRNSAKSLPDKHGTGSTALGSGSAGAGHSLSSPKDTTKAPVVTGRD